MAKPTRTSRRPVKNTVHSNKRRSRCDAVVKLSVRGQAAVQSERKKNRTPDCVIVRQPTDMKRAHKTTVLVRAADSHNRLINNQPQDAILPHTSLFPCR